MKHSTNCRLLYRQEQFPIFQNRMYLTEAQAKACPKGDVQLVENQETGLVYNAAFRPELMSYDADYQNEQALSPLFHQHLELVSAIVDRCLGKGLIVEVGCGKGYFLEMLLAKGIDVIGFDPTYEGQNPRVKKRYFEPGAATPARGLILRHVLEHVQDPFNFLQQLNEVNRGGRIYIEVPCFDWICQRRAWFDIFYEHVNYFRASDFRRMFGKVVESGRLFGGQYLYVVAELASLRRPEIDLKNCAVFPDNFTASLAQPGPEVLWGGASKGAIYALLRARSGAPVRTVIDINPAKQGKYLPATGLLVQSPQLGLASLAKGSTIVVMNSNYLEEIRGMSNNAFNYVVIDDE